MSAALFQGGVRCRSVLVPYLPGMTNDTRFEFRLPEPIKRELTALSGETGLSAADLVRLGVNQLLADRGAGEVRIVNRKLVESTAAPAAPISGDHCK
jgi:hypothetical protein